MLAIVIIVKRSSMAVDANFGAKSRDAPKMQNNVLKKEQKPLPGIVAVYAYLFFKIYK